MASDTQHAPARPAHRPSAREAMLDAAEAHLGAGGTLTLDSAARAAEVSKPGLMYHFATKEQLLPRSWTASPPATSREWRRP